MMLKIYTGNIKGIKKEMSKLLTQNNLTEMKLSKNPMNETLYGLFYKPKLYYFFYSKDYFPDKETIQRFIEFCESTDSIFVCICEEQLDKKTVFYRQLKSYIKDVNSTLNSTSNEKSEILKDLGYIYNIENKDFISVLFSLSYSKYRQVAGFVLNLILTGRLNNIDIAKKLFLVLATMR